MNKTKNPKEAWAIILAKSKLFFFFEITKSFKDEIIRNKALIIIKFDKILKFLKNKIIIKFIKIAPSNIKKFDNYSIEFKNLELKDFTNYQAIVGEFEILKEKDRNILKPEIRIYSNPKTLTYEASIKTSFIKDYYLTMSNIDRSDYYNIKFQEKPLMIWIWLSVIMIVCGGLLRFFKNAKNS